MPAVTVDDLTVLPRLRAPGLGDQPRPVWQVTTAPHGYEGEGFPVRRAFAGVDLRAARPVHHMDQMGEVEYAPGEPKGTPWHPHRGFETVTYIIDGVFDHQDSHGGGGIDHQRRHPVDDRRLRAPAHRDAAGVAGAAGRPVPRHPALGEPAARRRRWPTPRYQDLRSGEVGLLDHRRRRRAGAGHRRRRRRPRRPGLDAHPDGDGARDRSSPAPGSTCRGRSDFNALVYVLAGHGTVGAERPPDPGRASSPCSAPATSSRSAADGAPGEPLADARRDRASAAGRSASRRLGRPVRDEHQGRGAAGLRGLPEGPDGPDPGGARAVQRRHEG